VSLVVVSVVVVPPMSLTMSRITMIKTRYMSGPCINLSFFFCFKNPYLAFKPSRLGGQLSYISGLRTPINGRLRYLSA
jgi:hypothetical protein